MPSSHAQFAAFFAMYLTLFLLIRHHPKASTASSVAFSWAPSSLVQRQLLSIACLTTASLVSASRIYLSYHTPKQVLVGVAAGAVFAGIWFGFTELARNWRIVDWVLDLGLFKALRVRDLVVEEDLWEAGWKEWETRRLQRAQAEQKGGLRTTEPENTGKKER